MYSKLLLPVEIHTRVVVAVRAPIHSYLVGARAGMLGDTSDTGHMAAQQAARWADGGRPRERDA